jgi:long-chain fatty acid transport protein
MHRKILNVRGRLLKGIRYTWPFALMLPMAGVQASGFALIEQSASGQGNAFAGAATSAEDPSVMYYNPAAMTLVKGRQSTLGLHYIHPKASFTNQGSKLPSIVGGGALTGPNDNGGQTGYVPNLYYLQHLNPDVVIGLGINAPFGLSTEYDANWVGRYHAVKSDLKTININPSIAWRLDN